MRTATALLIALSLGATADAELEIRGLEAAHGRYGPRRETLTVYPGEEVFFRYLVSGAEADARGRIDIELDELVSDGNGKPILHAREPMRSILALGGGTFTGQAVLTLPESAGPGAYKLTITVRDKLSGGSTVGEQILTLAPAEFALIMPRFSYDAAGEVPAPPAGRLGQTLHLSVKALGLDASRGRIDAKMQLQIYDESNRPTMPQPITVTYRQDDPKVAEQIGLVRFKAEVALNRVGKFTLKMSITDVSTGKVATFSSPLVVSEGGIP